MEPVKTKLMISHVWKTPDGKTVHIGKSDKWDRKDRITGEVVPMPEGAVHSISTTVIGYMGGVYALGDQEAYTGNWAQRHSRKKNDPNYKAKRIKDSLKMTSSLSFRMIKKRMADEAKVESTKV